MSTAYKFAARLVAGVAVACAAPAPEAAAGDAQLGIELFKQGKYAEASAQLQGESGTDANAYLAASLAKQGQLAEAEGAANVALAGDGTHPVAVAALGESLVGQKRYDEAVARLSAVIEKRNDVAYAYYWRGQAWSKKKQPSHMVADFENFVKLAPDAPEAGSVKQLLAGLR
jgi:tetratricopeptide (TPR) repeat protein